MGRVWSSVAFVVVLTASGCGTDELESDPMLEPPAATEAYDPSDGQGEGGGGYSTTTGQASAGGGDPSGPTGDAGSQGSTGAEADCAPSERRCLHAFERVDDGFNSVDVMGNFADDGWDVGVPMSLERGIWRAAIPLRWDRDTEYRFRVDGSGDWELDPEASQTENDNSVVRALMCDPYACDG